MAASAYPLTGTIEGISRVEMDWEVYRPRRRPALEVRVVARGERVGRTP